jgi:hypothetical protein
MGRQMATDVVKIMDFVYAMKDGLDTNACFVSENEIYNQILPVSKISKQTLLILLNSTQWASTVASTPSEIQTQTLDFMVSGDTFMCI